MKIFDKTEFWTSKVNFVDENNVLLGYDTFQSCCEAAGWFIADKPCKEPMEDVHPEEDYSQYRFDPEFFREESGSQFDAGGMVIFRITDGVNERFLHLYNIHNGYYSHGFTFSKDGNVIQDSYL